MYRTSDSVTDVPSISFNPTVPIATASIFLPSAIVMRTGVYSSFMDTNLSRTLVMCELAPMLNSQSKLSSTSLTVSA
ncbi:unnamed protein product [Phytophthora fragariaefolia]|uniref:Unnamed protein product n=1 Tax=Phytophthora fragariaefolia TaxID=1490495 RepID=A0A9W6XST2_9STRA|nr:unnamed protein product [Phytophthora fragariaefolia]